LARHTYPWVPGSARVLTNADGSPSDLVLFRLSTRPPLPRLPVRAEPLAVGERVVLIGFRKQRTASATWQGHRGFSLGTSGDMRWGTNVVEQTNVMLAGAGARTNGFTGEVHEMDARMGGGYQMSFTNFSTGSSNSFGGKDGELKPHERIRYTDRFDDPGLPGEMQVTVALRKVDCGTELEIVQEGIPSVIPVESCYLG
jgi:Activator of Hsp90 ATPase homolog 1-like protein